MFCNNLFRQTGLSVLDNMELYMKNLFIRLITIFTMFSMGILSADIGKGLNLTVTSADRQTQMMSMLLSVLTIVEYKKEVNVVFCGAASDLALKSTKTKVFKPIDKSPTMLLNKILKLGANVEVCPMYLPSVKKSLDDLIKGITIAKPPVVTGRLLDKDYLGITF